MSVLTAVLFFPLRPREATRAVGRRFAVVLFPLGTAAAAGAFFGLRGCPWPDAAVIAGVTLAASLSLAIGGLLGTWLARLVLGRDFSWPDHAAGCLVFATWTAPVFLAVLAVMHAVGGGPTAPLAAGFGVLIWGIVTGLGVIGAPDHPDQDDQGRGIVASCLGLLIALLSLVGVLVLVHTHLLLIWPAPLDEPPVARGDVMLVRVEPAPPAGALILARNSQGMTVLGRMGTAKSIAVLGLQRDSDHSKEGVRGPWSPVGRVFFAFGGWGGRPVPAKK